MKPNPSKFRAIIFKCRDNEEVFDLNNGGEFIKLVSAVKPLGVSIEDNLSFNEHVSMYVSRPHDRQLHYAEL